MKEARQGTCEKQWFANKCKATCGLCDPRGTPTTSPTPKPTPIRTPRPTTEPTPSVTELTQEATPAPTPERVPELTPESTPTPSPAPSKVCVDTANSVWCKKEARQGTCEKQWFANKCTESCGLCNHRRLENAIDVKDPPVFV